VIADQLRMLAEDTEEEIRKANANATAAQEQAGAGNAGTNVCYVRVRPEDEVLLSELQHILTQHHGNIPVLLFYTATRKARELSARYAVSMSPAFTQAVERLLGTGAVVIKTKESSR
ncbi:MAG: hypothetical protein ACXVDB_03650, partial [Tumebacillaceae bacterium]